MPHGRQPLVDLFPFICCGCLPLYHSRVPCVLQCVSYASSFLFTVRSHCHTHNTVTHTTHTKTMQGVEGDRQWSKAKRRPQQISGVQQSWFISQQIVFQQAHKWSLSCIDNSAAWAAKETHSCYNQISPLDNKMEDICVSSARMNTIFSTITRLIKS